MPKPEPRPLRTLPERAFRARARLVAALLCCVCFAGLAARLAYLQLFTGSWYTSRALGQQLRDTVVPADRGRIYSADGALLAANSSCWTLRASPREMPEEKLSLAADGLAEILELDKAALLEKFSDRRSNDCLLRLRKALAALPGSLTVFIVSQRAASLQHADQILVLDDGHLVGIGTHDQLRQTCPVYEEIYESQFKKGDAQK